MRQSRKAGRATWQNNGVVAEQKGWQSSGAQNNRFRSRAERQAEQCGRTASLRQLRVFRCGSRAGVASFVTFFPAL
ncbi:MAG: hypothetical protein BHW56_02320 [Acetobacter sp. 46_36]|nr:MAG: hypothetical protein BHW56_02320 [Acetobacter sp. 46_36]